ncbi:hypothetical protein AYO50_00400 [Acidobacteria bacterium SCGC AG-212-P17]|nr:hypothetical protein AYO50_00400 [Acidobacteria bacterium SCGC AG-212-P17]
MRVHLIFIVHLMAGIGMTQSPEGQVIPSVTTARVEDGAVTVLHLAPGYATSVRLPEEITSVVIGNPASFKAEHSEAEVRLVFFKPTTSQSSESNALITTKSGQEISLHLVSTGKGAADARVDFLVEYRPPQSVVISPERQSFLIADTRPLSPEAPANPADASVHASRQDSVANQLERQKSRSSPAWQGKELLGALGDSQEMNHQTILSFSVLNDSKRVIELLPPQLELTGNAHTNGGKRIKGEPVAISDFRMTTRRLQPGQRTDGVIVFERPGFKESTENLQLQLATAEQVDRPILLPVPFTPSSQGGAQ